MGRSIGSSILQIIFGFQVQALVGFIHGLQSPTELLTYQFPSQSSDWNNTQTLVIPNFTDPSPTIPEVPLTVSLGTVLVAVSLLLILRKRKLTIINH